MAKSLVEAVGLAAGRVPPGVPAPPEAVRLAGDAAPVVERLREELAGRGQDPAALQVTQQPPARWLVACPGSGPLPPAPSDAPAALVIRGDTDGDLDPARQLARRAVDAGGWDRVVVTRSDRSVLEFAPASAWPSPEATDGTVVHAGPVAAVLLAAGTSSRMGRPKQLILVRGEPLVRHAARAALAAGFDPVLVVTGAHGEAVAAALDGLPVTLVANPDFASGQASSMAAGIRALPDTAEALALVLVDQPDLGAADLGVLRDAWQRWPGPAVVPLYAGERGSPVVFGRETFPELLAVTGDRGGRGVLERLDGVGFLAMPNPAAGRDVDLPGDLGPGGEAGADPASAVPG